MEEEKEKKRDFVSIMLEKAEERGEETKPNTVDQDPKEIERLTANIKRKIQQG